MDCQWRSGVMPLNSSFTLIDPKAWILTGRPNFKYDVRQSTAAKMEDERHLVGLEEKRQNELNTSGFTWEPSGYMLTL